MEPIRFLQQLITEDTPILELKNNSNITTEQKYNVLGFSSGSLAKDYIKMMYHQNFIWYYFKQEEKYGFPKYPFYLLDELMGSYHAQLIELPAVSFQVARTETSLGLASENFRKNEFDYYFFDQLPAKELVEGSIIFINIEVLKSICIDSINADRLVDHILKLLALDLYMLQRDRCNINLQFQMNRNTGFLDLATIYDFSKCASKWERSTSFMIWNPIISLDNNNIPILCKKYPQILEYLDMLLTKTMSATWNQICEDYHFNQNSYAYEQAKDYYQLKDENQKNYLKYI